MNENKNLPHLFTGIDGRCYFCDMRASSRYLPEACDAR
jgi:hypothetical protein